MTNTVTLAVDLMGGDTSSSCVASAILKFFSMQTFGDIHIVAVADTLSLKDALKKQLQQHNAITLIHVDDYVAREEKPAQALKNKRFSSMAVVLKKVANGQAHACLSLGNTGAYMALSRHIVKCMPGVDRPAICKALPSKSLPPKTTPSPTWLLDLGANVDCSSKQLLAFAHMGFALAKSCGVKAPKVALLNIGVESEKGNTQVKASQALIKKHFSSGEYIGFVEANHLYNSQANVIVCDGFAGNVAIKACEGTVSFLLSQMTQNELDNTTLMNTLNQYNPSKFNGAILLGLQNIVVKSHGDADELGIIHALQSTYEFVKSKVIDNVKQQCLKSL